MSGAKDEVDVCLYMCMFCFEDSILPQFASDQRDDDHLHHDPRQLILVLNELAILRATSTTVRTLSMST